MRCFGDGDPVYERYHDEEWGRPDRSERGVLERICLESFQSGISWRIVLGKRDAIRRAFHSFDADAIAEMDERDVERLLQDASIIRNRAKIEATVANGRATVALRDSDSPLERLVWAARPDHERAPSSWTDVPSFTEEAKALAKTLKRAGFRFVGPTTMYSSLQAIGVVNDHLASCPVRSEVEALR